MLDQLELQLEELEADTAEAETADETRTAEAVAVQGFVRRRPVRGPLPAHLPRERVVIPVPGACPAAAAGSPSWARTSPRRWRWCRGSGR